MGSFVRYLASLMLHIAWQRAGNRGGVPPIRLTKRGPVTLPVIGPWQMMIAMWVLRKLWAAYGDDVKGHMLNSKNKFVNQVATSLPSTPGATTTQNAAPDPDMAAPAPVYSQPSTPPSYATQPLAPAAPRPGSLLSRLRGSTSPG